MKLSDAAKIAVPVAPTILELRDFLNRTDFDIVNPDATPTLDITTISDALLRLGGLQLAWVRKADEIREAGANINALAEQIADASIAEFFFVWENKDPQAIAAMRQFFELARPVIVSDAINELRKRKQS